MACHSPLKGFVNNGEEGGIVFRRIKDAGKAIDIACGQCLGCRLDHALDWTIRIMHEASLHTHNRFITLTYDDDHLPELGSLKKSDFQKFMKRLRKRFSDRRIRYYHCGEYGDELDRPHYHAALFNLRFPDEQLLQQRERHALFTSEILQQLWPYGFVTVGDLTFDSAAYAARYCLKKVSGFQGHEHYLRHDENGEAYWLQPEYASMSRRPGLGYDWYQKFKSDVFPSDEIPVPGKGVLHRVPNYYLKLLEQEDPETHKQIKRKRQKFHDDHADDYTPHRLTSKHIIKKRQLESKTRPLERRT